MNYYEHHIGDFAQATAHLSFVEDAAYSRLIRKYYAEEKPLPADTKAVQRLVGARSREEKEAVATILNEFFVLAADGWHNKRCDSEIVRYQDKQAKAKRSAAARWHKPAEGSDGIASAAPGAMRTHSDGNAHQAPDTTPQTPLSEQATARSAPAASAAVFARADEISRLLHQQGTTLPVTDPRLRAWADSGISDSQLLAALDTARIRRASQGNTQPVNAGLLDAILVDLRRPARQPAGAGKKGPAAESFDNRDYGQGGPL
jgi:uncharacterized protein YdaU (DUF1376 family)